MSMHSTNLTNVFQFQLGPLLYDATEQRGIKRSFLPSPRKENFNLDSTYTDIVKRGRELFFTDEADEDDDCFWLTEASGHPLPHFSEGVRSSHFYQKCSSTV